MSVRRGHERMDRKACGWFGWKAKTWRAMAEICARSINRRCVIVPVPASLLVVTISHLKRVLSKPIDVGIVQRFGENVDIPLSDMATAFAVRPRDFEAGLNLALENWRREGVV